jgi:hypothetical protein
MGKILWESSVFSLEAAVNGFFEIVVWNSVLIFPAGETPKVGML